MFYLINLLLVPIYYAIVVGKRKNDDQRIKRFSIIFAIHAILLRALANPFNYTDIETYEYAFRYIKDMSFSESVFTVNVYTAWGPLYVLLNWIVGYLTDNFQWFYALIAFLSIAPVVWYHYKSSDNLLCSLCMYLTYPMMYIMGFGVLRQHLAIAITLVAVYYVRDAKKYFALMALAFLCHTSSIAFIPFYFVRRFSLSQITTKRVLLLLFVGIVFIRLFALTLMHNFDRNDSYGREEASNMLPVILLGSMSLLFFIMGVYRKLNSFSELDLFSFILYGLLLAITGIGVNHLGRLSLGAIYVFPIGLTLLTKYTRGVNRTLVIVYCMIFVGLIIYSMITSSHTYNYVPFWQDL